MHRNKNTKDKFPTNFKILLERTYGVSKIYFGKFLCYVQNIDTEETLRKNLDSIKYFNKLDENKFITSFTRIYNTLLITDEDLYLSVVPKPEGEMFGTTKQFFSNIRPRMHGENKENKKDIIKIYIKYKYLTSYNIG